MQLESQEEIESVITKCVLELCEINNINTKLNLVSDLYMDSLDLVYLAAALEEIFGIRIEDWEIANSAYFSNIELIAKFIIQKKEV